MICNPTDVEGVFVIEAEPCVDERGMFARVFDDVAFRDLGLEVSAMQFSVSFNPAKGTLRGMHCQSGDDAEVKLIRCTQGAVYDVAIDLRPESPSFRRWVAAELTAANHRQLYVPKGCAHGFLTLEPNTEVYYQIFQPYVPASSVGVRWNDPAFSVKWPSEPALMSPRDAGYADFAL
jgi:dTDP-4-dehydrorhamnose 3,5-epimerase